MKKTPIFLLVALSAIMTLTSCEDETPYLEESASIVNTGGGTGGGGTGGGTASRRADLGVYRGARVNVTEVFKEKLVLNFKDTASTFVSAGISINGSLIKQHNSLEWSDTLFYNQYSSTGDEIVIAFQYQGNSALYGWNYHRNDTLRFRQNGAGYLNGESRITYRLGFYQFRQIGDSLLYDDRTSGSDLFYNIGNMSVTGVSYFINGDTVKADYLDGDMHVMMRITTEGFDFDQIALYYDNYLLDVIDSNSWIPVYYLDEFYLGGEMHFRLTRNGETKRYPIQLSMSH